MRKIIVGFCISLVWMIGITVTNINAQRAWGISIVQYDTETRIVDGYSGTWLDYSAGLYYDPEVIGDLYRTDMNETSLDHGRSFGYGQFVPAEVFLRTTNFVEGRTYCTYSQHAVWGYFYYVSTSQWFDPFRYSTFFGSPSPWPGFPFSYYYVFPRRYYLGYTQACIAVPLPPPPTPSPTPTPTPPPTTPTPTPTPCPGGAAGGECPAYTVTVGVNPATLRPSAVTGGGNTANVSVCIRPAQADLEASFQLVRRPEHADSGGHVDSQHIGVRPLGKLGKRSGRTSSDGCLRTKYSPSHISGFVGINGTITGTTAGTNMWVQVPNLLGLSDGEDYNFIGSRPWHPANHNGTLAALTGLQQIAADYRQEYYGNGPMPENEKLHYNDMSLTSGGKFDLAKNWLNTGDHGEHREGINADVRCCVDPGNIPRSRWARLDEIFEDRGSTDTNDETGTSAPHWHLRFLYGAPNTTAERTPHIFVEDVFNAVLRRESTQEEYEIWLSRITNAKATGQSELLAEAKSLVLERFLESGYGGRQRTDEQFIADVFLAHVFREPTIEETQLWLDYLHNLPPSIPQSRKRRRLIETFQLGTEFQEVVFGIVDAPSPQQ
ncbi:MAG: hypothetical protein ACKVQW_05050 [Pyrinomonadaceae bacterium]